MHRLSVAEIADLVDELDDSDVDPDYTEKDADMDSSASEQEEDGLPLGLEAQSTKIGPEYRVYMEPPVERAEADSDKDSGKKNIIFKN